MNAAKTTKRCDANKAHDYGLDCINFPSFVVSISTEPVAEVCGRHLADTIRLYYAAVPDDAKNDIRVQPTH